MIDLIVYSSETGSCEKYAQMIAKELNVPAVPMSAAEGRPCKRVLYISWLTAGKINGLSKAMQGFPLAAVMQVGITPVTGETAAKTRKANKIPANTEVFCKQGGLHMDRLSAPYRAAMTVVNKVVLAQLSKKKNDLDDQERALYGMVTTGDGEPADWDVSDVVAWCRDS